MNTSTKNTINMTIAKQTSKLDGIEFVEMFQIKRLLAVLQSNYLLNTWENTNYTTELGQLTDYSKLFSTAIGGCVVKYAKPKHKIGRSFPIKGLGLSSIRREVRNTLIGDTYDDFDIENAQPNIILNICKDNGMECKALSQYCENRDDVLLQVQSHYNVSREISKELFLSLCFGGTVKGWYDNNNIQSTSILSIINDFEKDMYNIANQLKKANPTLYETARRLKQEKTGNSSKSVLSSFFGLYNQEYEHRIVESVLNYLIHHTSLLKHKNTSLPVGTYEFDGIKLLKENVNSFIGGQPGVIELLNAKTFELTGFKLNWTIKHVGETYDINELMLNLPEQTAPNQMLINDMYKITNALDSSDCGIIESIKTLMPNHFINSSGNSDAGGKNWYCWNAIKTRWENSDAPLRYAIMYSIEKYWKQILNPWTEHFKTEQNQLTDVEGYKFYKSTIKSALTRIKELKSATGVNNCVSVAKTLLANNTMEFDTNPDLFGCENGVIDIKNECFRPYQYDDYITMSCKFDFTPYILGFSVYDSTGIKYQVKESDITEEYTNSLTLLEDIFNKILPDASLRNYVFKVISTGMSGNAIEKFFVYNGAGRNGKGLANEFLEVVFGEYFCQVDPIIFSENQKKKTSSGANPEIAKLNKKRYIVSKEPAKESPLHNSVIKSLTGGGSVSARNCYSSNTEVKLCGTIVMECNEKPPFSEPPKDADIERINDILFKSSFTDKENEWDITTGQTNYKYPVDASLKTELKRNITHKNTMLNLLLPHIIEVKQARYNIDNFKPDCVKLRSMEYVQVSYDIHNIFIRHFERRIIKNVKKYQDWRNEYIDEDWTLSKIATQIRKLPEFFELTKAKQREHKPEVIEQFFRTNIFYKDYVYMNTHKHSQFLKDWRKKPNSDEFDVVEDSDEEIVIE